MTVQRDLSDINWTIGNCLRSAYQRYSETAKLCREPNQPPGIVALGEQFEKQAREAMELANLFEDAVKVTVEVDVIHE